MHKNLLILARIAMPLLCDPVWQFVGVILTAIGIVVAIIISMQQRNCKSLSYDIISEFPLFRGDKDLIGLLEVTFNGKAVRSAYSVSILFRNTGNVPILPTDYEQPIIVDFGKKSQVLQAATGNCNPRSVAAGVDPIGGKIMIKPVLLNPGDEFSVRVLVNEPDLADCPHLGEQKVELNLTIRIAGVKDVARVFANRTKRAFIWHTQLRNVLIFAPIRLTFSLTQAVWRDNISRLHQIKFQIRDSEQPLDTAATAEVDMSVMDVNPTENENSASIEEEEHDVLPDVFAVSRSVNVPTPTFSSLKSSEHQNYIRRALQRLQEDGIENPSERAINHYAQAIFSEDNRMLLERIKIQQKLKLERAKVKMTASRVCSDALRRLPQNGDK